MELGTCYYPEHWPEERWAIDAALMRDAGLNRVRIGEFAWSRIEPEPGRHDWSWLDRAIAVLADAGLHVVLGTPTATPPKWLVDRMPDMLAVDREGRQRGFGSRRHYCFSHPGYRREAVRITQTMAERYGKHPAVIGWQTDNEYGCHDTVQSFSDSARNAFRTWLADRYGTVAALNATWGNVFWSMEYRAFDEIDLPNGAVTEANPAHWLAFRRFSSDQVVAFNKAQVAILRAHSPGRFVMHNAMGFYTGYDHHTLASDLDSLAWDSYPLGFTEMFRFSAEEKRLYARCGHPDIAAFHHDLYRGCGARDGWGVIEQQPGPVNWARHNPAPLPGMVRLWSLEAYAHGAAYLHYFRWRQAPFAQEQMHAGLLRADASEAPGLAEARQTARDLAALGIARPKQAEVAILFDYAAEWMSQIQPQGDSLSALWACFRTYEAVRKLGLDVDILPPDTPLDGYAMVLLPCLPIVEDELAQRLAAHGGSIVIGPRTGSRNRDFRMPDNLAPGLLERLVGGRIVLSESFSDALPIEGDGWQAGRWFDHYEGDAEPCLTAKDGRVVCWRRGSVFLAASWMEGDYASAVVERAASATGLSTAPLPPGVRQRRHGNRVFTFDYPAATVRWSEL